MTVAPRGRRAVGVLAVTLAAGIALLGCAPSVPPARPVTSDESQLLAVIRFNNFDSGARSFTTSLRDAGTELGLTGWVDYTTGVGYAELFDAGMPVSLLLWNGGTIAARPIAEAEGPALLVGPILTPTPLDGFESAPLTAQGALHPLLGILIALGNDRPDNPLLLQQGGAQWLRTDTVGTTAVTVFSGPTGSADEPAATDPATEEDASNVRYWVDAGGLLLRCEVRLGVDWVTIDLGTADDVHLTDPFSAPAP